MSEPRAEPCIGCQCAECPICFPRDTPATPSPVPDAAGVHRVTGWLMTQDKAGCKEAADLIIAQQAELDRLRAVIATHNLCHDLHGKVGRAEFEEGCRLETVKVFGSCGWADELDRLRAENAEAQDRESERDALHAAVRDDARAALKDALGEQLWYELWGPELETLGGVVYEVWRQRQRLQAENERLQRRVESTTCCEICDEWDDETAEPPSWVICWKCVDKLGEERNRLRARVAELEQQVKALDGGPHQGEREPC